MRSSVIASRLQADAIVSWVAELGSFGMDRMFAKRMIAAVTVSAGCVLLVLGVGHIIRLRTVAVSDGTRNSLRDTHTPWASGTNAVVSTNNIRPKP